MSAHPSAPLTCCSLVPLLPHPITCASIAIKHACEEARDDTPLYFLHNRDPRNAKPSRRCPVVRPRSPRFRTRRAIFDLRVCFLSSVFGSATLNVASKDAQKKANPVYILHAPSTPAASTTAEAIVPQEVYNGGYADATDVQLRIGNGGAGQSGLVGALADAFIQFALSKLPGKEPFLDRAFFDLLIS